MLDWIKIIKPQLHHVYKCTNRLEVKGKDTMQILLQEGWRAMSMYTKYLDFKTSITRYKEEHLIIIRALIHQEAITIIPL